MTEEQIREQFNGKTPQQIVDALAVTVSAGTTELLICGAIAGKTPEEAFKKALELNTIAVARHIRAAGFSQQALEAMIVNAVVTLGLSLATQDMERMMKK